MNTPVSFSTAKLAIQKGFDKECKEYWNLIEYSSEWIVEHRINPDSVDFMYAPTIAEVVMWLYEKHGIWIYADSHEFGKWCYYYRFNRPNELYPRITENGQFSLEDYNSPTEAYEAAIIYTLNDII